MLRRPPSHLHRIVWHQRPYAAGVRHSKPPPISNAYMFAMWFSGLRGGVAFALAAVSFAHKDFDTSCGGMATAERRASTMDHCDEGMTDSLAILQTTLIIASFTIFVFGGAITDLAIWLKVLDKPSTYQRTMTRCPTSRLYSHYG